MDGSSKPGGTASAPPVNTAATARSRPTSRADPAPGFQLAMARATGPAAMPRPDPPTASVAVPAATGDSAFRASIAREESRGRGGPEGLGARNPRSGALGRYQITPQTFQDIGWKTAGGAWTATAARHGVRSDADFMASRAAQESAMDAVLRRAEVQLDRNGSLARAGTEVMGLNGQAVQVTEAGLIAAAHRRGAGSVARYLQHQTDAPAARLSPAQRQAYAAVERRLQAYADLPYTLAGRPLRGTPG